MKFKSYEDYVLATQEYYKDKDIKINKSLLILPIELFNKFNGKIDFGAGSKKCNGDCNCVVKCLNHKTTI